MGLGSLINTRIALAFRGRPLFAMGIPKPLSIEVVAVVNRPCNFYYEYFLLAHSSSPGSPPPAVATARALAPVARGGSRRWIGGEAVEARERARSLREPPHQPERRRRRSGRLAFFFFVQGRGAADGSIQAGRRGWVSVGRGGW